jgi:hypothetical protein
VLINTYTYASREEKYFKEIKTLFLEQITETDSENIKASALMDITGLLPCSQKRTPSNIELH